MQLILLGAPGTGKGTQASFIAKKYRIKHISTGDILRDAVKAGTELGKKAKNFMDSGELVPDSVMIGLVKERLTSQDCASGFILDGFPRTIPQAEALDGFLVKRNQPISKVILLHVEREVLIQRLTGRRICRNCGKVYNIITAPPPQDNRCSVCGGEVYRRSDDSEETVSNRLDVFELQTKPLLEYFEKQGKVKRVDGNKDIDAVQKLIENALVEE
ncbi:adenylate kinase [candidate division KSB1 bacterium]|nr:adenylate kinase [candidate division KSB1 bacterium]